MARHLTYVVLTLAETGSADALRAIGTVRAPNARAARRAAELEWGDQAAPARWVRTVPASACRPTRLIEALAAEGASLLRTSRRGIVDGGA
ncbi:hypothetical protein [Roseisolibacter sp. H3M3-2]|uniref:hypothetical protein n=1 Tax=Roseisolibacter sp. H3M3-2 TaxID=3031323 RepID=UPI0023DA56B7|nr:hypothetical protein [Roseisolibacter sp. H3M3-2]MDF1502295.1 hypothetical protein [Roseisolibacter sp. H3M3-2]